MGITVYKWDTITNPATAVDTFNSAQIQLPLDISISHNITVFGVGFAWTYLYFYLSSANIPAPPYFRMASTDSLHCYF